MRITMVAAEATPYVKVGGLADVAGSLPGALARLGCQVELVLPGHATIDRQRYGFSSAGAIRLWYANRGVTVDLQRVHRDDGVTVTLVDDADAFDRPGVYDDPETKEGYGDNAERFAFFARVAAEMIADDPPDLVHVHDSHAGLVPGLLKVVLSNRFERVPPCVLTIHNLAYQMPCRPETLVDVGFPRELFYSMSPLEFYGQGNFLKTGIYFSDAITTVSETYAREIQSDEFGCGMQGLLRYRSGDLFGILNGIDTSIWDPSRDPFLPAAYSETDLSGKRVCREQLIRAAGLEADDGTPVIGMVGRLADQKGLDIFAEAAGQLAQMDARFVILGSGQEKYHQLLNELHRARPDKFAVYLGFNDELAHRIEAGSDYFLMPSRFEPCGLNQMYSMRYGTIPIVRKTGGLADTVIDVEERRQDGTGFVFQQPRSNDLLGKVDAAIDLHRRGPAKVEVIRRGMAQDFSQHRSAAKYLTLFRRLVHG